jgi:hypothetical protein
MTLRLVTTLLWLLQPVVLAGVVVRMRALSVHRQYPLFFSYAIFELLRNGLLLAVFYYWHARYVYFWTYWSTDVVESVLTFLVVYEIFAKVFDGYAGLRRLGRLLFHCAAAAVVLLAILSTALAFGRQSDPLIAGVLSIQHGTAIVNGGLLVFLFAFCWAFRLAWRVYVLGIALGFGAFFALNLVAVILRMELGTSAALVLSLLNNIAYDCAVLVWLVYLMQRDRATSFSGTPRIELLDEWNRTLLALRRS